jgi:hypothetical protein
MSMQVIRSWVYRCHNLGQHGIPGRIVDPLVWVVVTRALDARLSNQIFL